MWLDPSTVRVGFKLINQSQDLGLKLANSNPASFFRRMRILSGGQVVEDISEFGRVSNMLHTLLPFEKRVNDAAEGFGVRSEYGYIGARLENTGIGSEALNDGPVICAGGNRMVFFPLLCSGLLSQSKFLPLKYLSLQIELELVSSF